MSSTRLVRVPVSEAVWSMWWRYCRRWGWRWGAGGLIAHELGTVDGSTTGGGAAFAGELQRRLVARAENLDVRERRLDDRELSLRASERRRNARLAAIHSLFRFAAFRHPEHSGLIARVLDIPTKRAQRTDISYLVEAEVEAVLSAPDTTTRCGRRAHALLAVAVQTGLRVAELVGLRRHDVILGTGARLTCVGKGGKQRSTPRTVETAHVVQQWLAEREGDQDAPLFLGPTGGPLTTWRNRDVSWRTADGVIGLMSAGIREA